MQSTTAMRTDSDMSSSDGYSSDSSDPDIMLALSGTEAGDGVESSEVERESAIEACGDSADDEDDASSSSLDLEEQEDGVDEPAAQTVAIPVKKKPRPSPMTKEAQVAAIAALEEKLAEFPPSQTKKANRISLTKKKQAKQAPTESKAATGASSAEIAQTPEKKRKRGPKATKPPQPPKRPKKMTKHELKQPNIIPAVQRLIDLVAKLTVFSTVKDVQEIVDAAAELLDDKPDGQTFNEEIKALLEREEPWKEMVRKGEPGLREEIKRFMERFGILPMGALEAAESMGLEGG